MNPAVLHGREHTTLGAVAAIAEGRCAVALSRGGARKTYRHVDPTEDAAAFFAGAVGLLVMVADAHDGCDASEIAVERLLQRHAPAWTGGEFEGVASRWSAAAHAAFADVNAAIIRHGARGGSASSRTTLAFALARPDEDLLAFASIGDSHAFRIDADRAVELAPATVRSFLGGPEETAEDLRAKCVVGATPLAGARALLLVTDGLSERGIGVEAPEAAALASAERAARAKRELRPLEAARTIVELALSAHRGNAAGDNVASAALWLEP
jgi:serine/threonine protein phosphatase PrpC